MSQKHKKWAWLRPRNPLVVLQLFWVTLLASVPSRRLSRDTRGEVGMEEVGYALAVVGGVVALGSLLGLIFVPVATFPLIDAEWGAVAGLILLVGGVVVHAAGSR